MKVDGPNKREFSSVLAQLRHLYMLMERNGSPLYQPLLSRQIRRLESLERVLFELPQAADAVARTVSNQAEPSTRVGSSSSDKTSGDAPPPTAGATK